MRIAVDTNIISALWSPQPLAKKANAVLNDAASEGDLVICGIVYSELLACPGATAEFVGDFLDNARIVIDAQMNFVVWREAGVRFARYSRRRARHKGGVARRLIANFVIGSHAMLATGALLTFNTADFAHDFPKLRLLS